MSAPSRPTYAEIDLQALLHNARLARARIPAGGAMLAVVKADAYGHGAVPVARALAVDGVEMFGVALLEEALELREAGLRQPILLLGGAVAGQEEELLAQELVPCLYDLAGLQRLAAAAARCGRPAPFHLKLDTGMSRLGFLPEELPAVLDTLKALPQLRCAGLVSHLALADEPADPFTDAQLERFRAALATLRQAGVAPPQVHISNSAALFSRELPECTLVRPGIALYGAQPFDDPAYQLPLRPVLQLRSAVLQLKRLPAGTGVSYGHRYRTVRETLLAVIPIGYADGYNRLLTGCGEVLIRGRRAPLAGTVCMDWIMVDVTDIPEVAVGDRVTLLGSDGAECISAEEWAAKLGTISYEVFCRIGPRVPRRYLSPQSG